MRNYGCFGDARALGALSILTSFLYLSDACFNVLTIHKQQSSWKVDFLYISGGYTFILIIMSITRKWKVM